MGTELECPDCQHTEFSWITREVKLGSVIETKGGARFFNASRNGPIVKDDSGVKVQCQNCTREAQISDLVPSPENAFRYRLEFNEDKGYEIVVESPCPNCGNETVFNGRVEEYAQYVSMDESDEGKDICRADDIMNTTVSYLSCGRCNTLLVDGEEGEEA